MNREYIADMHGMMDGLFKQEIYSTENGDGGGGGCVGGGEEGGEGEGGGGGGGGGKGRRCGG